MFDAKSVEFFVTKHQFSFHLQRQSVEAAMENAEREMASLRQEKNAKSQELSALEMKYGELQVQI